ncbi:MAG: hypothetical protein ACFFDT_02475 [Candidatus Hodarchaeota archaeon]
MIQSLVFLCYVLIIFSLSLLEEFNLVWKLGVTLALTYLIIIVLGLSNRFYQTLLKRSNTFLLLLMILFPLFFILVNFLSNSLTNTEIDAAGYLLLLFGLLFQPFIFIYATKRISWNLLDHIQETSQRAYSVWIGGIILSLFWAGFIGLVLPNYLTIEEAVIPILPTLSIAIVGGYLVVAYLGYVAGTFHPAPLRTLAFSGFSAIILFFYLSLKGMTALFALFEYLEYCQRIDIIVMLLMSIIGIYSLEHLIKDDIVSHRFFYYSVCLFLTLSLGAQLWISDTYFESYNLLLAFTHGVGILIGLYAVINAVPVFLSDLGIIPDEALIPLFNLTTAVERQTQKTMIDDARHISEVEWGDDSIGRRKYQEYSISGRYKPDEIGEEDDPSLGSTSDDFEYDDDDDDFDDFE